MIDTEHDLWVETVSALVRSLAHHLALVLFFEHFGTCADDAAELERHDQAVDGLTSALRCMVGDDRADELVATMRAVSREAYRG